MKRILITVSLCIVAMASGLALFAQQPPRARDLYVDYGEGANRPRPPAQRPGRPGAKVQMELMRGDEISLVSSKHAVQNDDRIAFRFAVNYEGYMTVTNIGTSGKVNVLYAGRISPTSNLRVPEKGWIRVKGKAGNEVVNFIMSAGPLPELQQAGIQVSSATPQGGNLTSTDEAQEILALLNSRALQRGRDLVVEVEGQETYAVFPTVQALSEARGFSITLNHK